MRNIQQKIALLVLVLIGTGTLHAQHVAPSASRNYILSRLFLKGVQDSAGVAALSDSDIRQSVHYFDGLGRLVQQVSVQASPSGLDIVTPVSYDAYGRQDKDYLPYEASGATGNYYASALSDQASYYQQTTEASIPVIPNPYSQKVFESSPLDRVLSTGAPGSPWAIGSGHEQVFSYLINDDSEVPLWYVKQASDGSQSATTSSYYSAGTLYKNTDQDENGHLTITYKDKEGLVVCRKVQDSTGTYATTQYVYDDYGDLCYVLPPNAEKLTSIAESDTSWLPYLYAYHYDSRRRQVEKKIPGKGWTYTVYDKNDRSRLSQDAVQRENGYWLFMKYDALGRVVWIGRFNSTASRAALQSTLDGWDSTKLSETFTTSAATGYTNVSFPTDTTATYSLHYYDDYRFVSISGINNYPGLLTAPDGSDSLSTAVQGLPTGMRELVLGKNKLLLSLIYYDDKGRISKTASEHLLSGVDLVRNSYDFSGELTATTRRHYAAGVTTTPAVVISNTFSYDHAGRKLQTTEQINGASQEILSTMAYNGIGQLKTKYLHGNAGGSLQQVNYRYNARGWLVQLSSGLFTERLYYDSSYNGSVAQYNGNISTQRWGAGGVFSHYYTYSYDAMNRLLNAFSDEGYNESSITYDKVGNILSLTRPQENTTAISYHYHGDQLMGTTGGIVRNYSYDSNGSMTSDGLIRVAYNELGLPASVSSVSGSTVNTQYVYNATGEKLQKTTPTETRYYIDGIEYFANSTTSSPTIDFLHTEEGIARNNAGSYSYEYNLTDHLGNVRAMFRPSGDSAKLLQQYDYYAFGKAIGRVDNNQNHYLYNGKELQSETGLYDYGARFYDPVIARWTSVDPAVEDGQETATPYGYVFGDPIRLTDPDGRAPTDIIIIGANNSSVTIKTNLINASFNISSTGIDLRGNHTINGEKAVQVGLDLGSLMDPSGVTSVLSAGISAKNGEWLDAGMSVLGAIPLLGKLADAAKVEKDLTVIEKLTADAEKIADDGVKFVNGNSKTSTNAQHVYGLVEKQSGKIEKVGISGGKVSKIGKSYRATRQVNKLNKAAKYEKYESKILKSIEGGPGARTEALEAEQVLSKENRSTLNRDIHQKP